MDTSLIPLDTTLCPATPESPTAAEQSARQASIDLRRGLDESYINARILKGTQAAITSAISDLEARSTLILTQAESKATAIMDRADATAKEMISRARALAVHSHAVAIKINDEPIKKLTRTMHPQLPMVIGLLKGGMNPILVGPAGCGKTMLAEQAAEALNLKYGEVCLTAGASETWLFGRQTPGGFIEAEFSRMFREGGLFLADELDAADANLLLSINTAIANGHLFNPISGTSHMRHPDFKFMACANTFGKGGSVVYSGRSRLDAATLDRFTAIEVGYLDEVESLILPDETLRKHLQGVREKIKERGANEMVSYRFMDKLNRMMSVGIDRNHALSMLVAGWPKVLIDESGVLKLDAFKQARKESEGKKSAGLHPGIPPYMENYAEEIQKIQTLIQSAVALPF